MNPPYTPAVTKSVEDALWICSWVGKPSFEILPSSSLWNSYHSPTCLRTAQKQPLLPSHAHTPHPLHNTTPIIHPIPHTITGSCRAFSNHPTPGHNTTTPHDPVHKIRALPKLNRWHMTHHHLLIFFNTIMRYKYSSQCQVSPKLGFPWTNQTHFNDTQAVLIIKPHPQRSASCTPHFTCNRAWSAPQGCPGKWPQRWKPTCRTYHLQTSPNATSNPS